jgi:hypothetical protein
MLQAIRRQFVEVVRRGVHDRGKIIRPLLGSVVAQKPRQSVNLLSLLSAGVAHGVDTPFGRAENMWTGGVNADLHQTVCVYYTI